MKNILIIISLMLCVDSIAEYRRIMTNTVTGKIYDSGVKETQVELDAWLAENLNDKKLGNAEDWDVGVIQDVTSSEQDKKNKISACRSLEAKLKTPVDLTLSELNELARCK